MRRKWTRALAVTLSATFAAASLTGIMPAETARAQEAAGGVQAQLYVSAGGNDAGDGSQNSPFATVERARKEVARINGNMTGDIIVNIAAGDYYLDSTIVFDEGDSGTNGYEVIYRSADGNGKANLIGGERITGWEPTAKEDVDYDLDPDLVGKVWKVQLDKDAYEFNTLYVNDERAVMARTRNRDNNPNFPMAKGEYMRSTGGHNNNLNMNYNAPDLDAKAVAGMVNAQKRGEEEIAQVFVWDGGDWDWFTNTIPIASIDTAKSEFKFPAPPADYPEKYRTKYNIGGGARYFLQGNLAFMDVEGEYHYNKSTGVLYYYPKSGDGPMEDQTIVVPTMQKVLYFKGADKKKLADEPDPEKEVHNITIDGLAVKDTEFADYFTYSWNWGDAGAGIGHYPKAAEGSTNPSYCESVDRDEFRVGSITLTGTHDITIKNTRVKNSGLYGIIYAGDNRNNTLTDSVIENTGYGGLIFEGGYPAIGKYNNHNTVENVLIHEVGELVGHAVGMTVMGSGQNHFTNMEIYDTPKRAILVIGGFRRNGEGDKNYDEIRDMYTVGNHFDYIHVHDAQQDAGEDSAVFLSWLLAGRDVNRLHGSNDPNDLKTNLDGIDLSIDRYNYFNQMLITDVGADPSVIEKCTVGGLDTAMGVTGSTFTNIKAANTQHHLMAIRDRSGGDGYGDMYHYENCTNNLYTDDYLKTFDDDKMEYDKIGLKADFPKEYRTSKREYSEAPEDIYFYDDFEASRSLDLRKWNVEKGNLEMHIGYGYMSENPQIGKRSLPINADLNPGGIVVSRNFENDLNKVVTVKYLDRRKDYANNDRGDAVPTEILPNSFLRVDNGETALGLGAVGTKSKDYYQIRKGDELIQTDVKRCFGWHTFTFDYSSGKDVKLYIDEQLVAQYDESDGVGTSFSYIGMGDWEGKGGKAFFDQLYVYGGQDAPPVEELPLPKPPADVTAELLTEDFETENPVKFEVHKGNAQVEVTADPDNADNKVMHVTSPDDMVYYADGMDWANYTFECRIKIDNWDAGGTKQPWDNMAPVWNAGSKDDKGNFNRYSLKFRRATGDFSFYKRRPGSDTDASPVAAPADFTGKWHDYKISTTDGKITAYIDGVKIVDRSDSDNPNGTIGFDGINADYYVDDIKVTRQKTPVPSVDVEEGSYDAPVKLHLIPEADGQQIFYTLDGTDPRDPEHGQYYIPGMELVISTTTTLKFAAVMAGAQFSDVVEKTYTFKDQPEGVQQQFYVSPDGNDNNGGSADAPFRTLDQARRAVDAVNDDMTGDIIVNIAEGSYYLEDTLTFGTSDSGTNGHEVIYRSAGEPGSARIIGGEQVTGWTPADESDVALDMDESLVGKVYKTHLEGDYDFNTLYVNGNRAVMARTRNKVYDERFPASNGEYMVAAGGIGKRGLYYKEGDLTEKEIAGLQNAVKRGDMNAQLYVWSWDVRDWFTDTCYIDNVNPDTRAIHLKQKDGDKIWNTTKYGLGGGARYFLQGNMAFLDVPGEYYYNGKTGDLYYYPLEGENIQDSEVVVPVLDELIRLRGDDKADLKEEPDPAKQVHNITFSGLSLEMTDHPGYYSAGWDYSEWGYPEASQGATNPTFCSQTERVEYQYGAVTMTGTNHITIDKTRFTNLGYQGVDMYLDNDSNVITNCEFSGLGYGAVMMDGGYPGVGKYNNNHTVQNVLIHDIGQLIGHSAGISVLSSGYNLFSHMEIYNSPRRATFISSWQRQTAADSEYDDYNDIYVKYNKFEYIYGYNLEQDGGDDGAMFTFCLFTDPNRTHPNYFENIVLDKVGANPSMKDFTPNGMNLDCSALGVELKNMKIINPQHYNFRYDDKLKEDNINKAYYSGARQYTTFDDSKMPYDEIGLTDDFPAQFGEHKAPVRTYDDVYYREEFDDGLDNWWKLAGTPQTSDVYFSDSEDFVGNSFLADAFYNKSGDGCRIGKPFGTNLNQVVEIDFFDHLSGSKNNGYCGQSFQWKLNSFARVDNGRQQVALGVDSDVSGDYFVYKIGSITKATEVPRSYGWHTMKWDYTSTTDVKLYVDDILVYTAPAKFFNYIEMGDYGMGGFNAYDNVVIYGDASAEPPVDLPPVGEMPGEENALYAPGRVEAEEGTGEGLTVADCSDGGRMLQGLKAGDEVAFEVYSAREQPFMLDVRYAASEKSVISIHANSGKAFSAELAASVGKWRTAEKAFDEFELAAGKNTIVLKVEAGTMDLNFIDFMKRVIVYGVIEAEDGDFSEGTSQPKTEAGDGGTVLGFASPGQVYKYTFNAPADGDYTIMYRAAVYYDGQKVECWANGEQQNITDLPGNRSWETYQDINGGKIALKKGENEITLKLAGAGPWTWNFNWFSINEYTEAGPSNTEKLEAKVLEVENLLSNYEPGEAYYELKAVLLEAQAVLKNPQSQSQVDTAAADLEAAREKFLKHMEDSSRLEPEDVLKQITVKAPAVTDTMLIFENVPDYYDVSIVSSAPAGYVNKNRSLIMPDEDMEITLTLKVTRELDGRTAQGTIPVMLPKLTAADVAAAITVEAPAKKAERITLPPVPNGFKLTVKSSADNVIAADGTIHAPLMDTEVETVFTVSKPLTGAEAEITLKIPVKGIGKPYGVAIEANDIDGLQGTYIKVQNNEVFNFDPGDWLRYDNVDFGGTDQYSSIYVNTAVHPGWAGKSIEIILDNLENDPVGSLVVEAHGNDWGIYGLQEAVLGTKLSGYHTVYLRGVKGGSNPTEGVCGVKEIRVDAPSAPLEFAVSVDETIQNGTVTADKAAAAEGETVTLTITPADGYRLVEESLKVNDGVVEVKDNQFVMPGGDAHVTAQFEATAKYTITVSCGDAANGEVIPDKTAAEEGEDVTLTVSSGDGYRLVEGSLQANEGRVPITDGKFKMPAEDVLVTAEFEAIPPSVYTVAIASMENGSVWADPMSGTAGTNIRLTVIPKEGWRLTEGSLKAAAADGSEVPITDGAGFLMPESNVTVTAAFEKIPTDFSGLQEVYDQYKDLTQGSYSDVSWNEFMLKKSAAEAVLGNPDATQAEIDAAKAGLEEAYNNLEENPSTGNLYRDLLQKAYDYARNLSTEGVVDTAVKRFQEALKKAKALLDNPEAADAELEEAFDGLLDGIWGLGLTKGDKTTLELLIAKAELMAADQDKYVAAQWQLLLDQLAKAKEVMADGDAMEEDIRPASDELLDAILKQRFKARKDILQDILGKAEKVDESLYTEESVQVFRAALAYARGIMEDDTLSEEDQPTVDRAADDLEEAILNLVKKEDTDPTEPTEPVEPTDPTEPGDTEDPADPDGSADSEEPTEPGDPADPSAPADDGSQPSEDTNSNTVEFHDGGDAIVSPKTGDSANMTAALFMAVFGMMCAACVTVRKRRRKDS